MSVMAEPKLAPTESAPDVRAREVEELMTDDEQFSLIIGIFGQHPRMAPSGTSAY